MRAVGVPLLAGILATAWWGDPVVLGAWRVPLGWVLVVFFLAWNGLGPHPLPRLAVEGWQATARDALRRAEALPELATELLRFAGRHARI